MLHVSKLILSLGHIKNEEIMTIQEKKEAIQKVIFERAYELMENAEQYRGILFPKDANHNEISNASLKKAVQEWKENKPVFNKPAFL
jgi:hypothetical protein